MDSAMIHSQNQEDTVKSNTVKLTMILVVLLVNVDSILPKIEYAKR